MADESDYFVKFGSELQKELEESGTDRGVILMGASGVELALRSLVERALRRDLAKSLTHNQGPLGTVYAVAVAGLAMGLMSEDEHADIDRIRRIRNGAAHSVSQVSFDSIDRIRDLTHRPLRYSEARRGARQRLLVSPARLALSDPQSGP